MSTTLRRRKPIVAPSNDSSSKGIAMTSPSTNRASPRASRARRARARVEHRRAEIDAGDVRGSDRVRSRWKTTSPVPQQRSRTRLSARRRRAARSPACASARRDPRSAPIGQVVARRDSREHLAHERALCGRVHCSYGCFQVPRRSPPLGRLAIVRERRDGTRDADAAFD